MVFYDLSGLDVLVSFGFASDLELDSFDFDSLFDPLSPEGAASFLAASLYESLR